MERTELLEDRRHWVVKLGSAVLLRDGIHVDRPQFVSLVEEIDRLLRDDRRITVVSSGAVALGRQRVDDPVRGASDLPRLQALAALGQSRLIQMFDNELAQYDRRAAQILFARSDLDRRESFLNARLTLDAVHRIGAVPIINENDSVATEELRFGDNDRLAAMTCGLVNADLLVVLSDVAGVFDVEMDEVGERRFLDRIPRIRVDDPHLDDVAGPSTTNVGTGGMISKVAAARVAARFGVPTIIAPGKKPGVLGAIARGEDVGTLILPDEEGSLLGKKVWLGTGAMPVGTLVCDDGAVDALTRRGASLLPSGVISVDGEFAEGSVVELTDARGDPFARGVSIYSSEDVRKIAGEQSEKIDEILGFKVLDSVVHRDSMVLI